MMHLRTKEHLRLQEAERGKEESQKLWREHSPANTLILNCGMINVCCLKPPSVQYFATTALGNEYACIHLVFKILVTSREWVLEVFLIQYVDFIYFPSSHYGIPPVFLALFQILFGSISQCLDVQYYVAVEQGYLVEVQGQRSDLLF